MKLVVFIPAHNEAESLGIVINKIKQVFAQPSVNEKFEEKEIIVLNDNSTDETSKVAADNGAFVYDIAGKSTGVGRVMKVGVEFVLQHHPDIAVGIDADDQFDAYDIPRLIQPILEGKAHMVTGTKFTDKKNPPEGLSTVKLYGNYMVTWVVNKILGSHFTDVSCGFRAYSNTALLYMNIWGNRTYVQEAFLDFFYKDLTIVEVPIKARYKDIRKSRMFRFGGGVLNYAANSLAILFRSVRDYNAFTFFSTIAYILLILASPLAGFFWWHYFAKGSFSPYIFLGFVSSGLIVLAIALFVVGLFGDMLSRIRMNQERMLFFMRRERMLKHKQSKS